MRPTIKPYNRFSVLILAFLLVGMSACGFQLRGTNLLALQNAAIYIQSSGANILAAEVRQQLLEADVKTVSSATDADYIVTLSNESFRSKVLSVSPTTGKVEEYEVTYNAMLKITSKNESATTTDAEPITAARDYTFDKGAVLGKIEEESVLRRDIAKQAAESVLRLLRAAVQ
jgi:LPS-assembly lipoprotein